MGLVDCVSRCFLGSLSYMLLCFLFDLGVAFVDGLPVFYSLFCRLLRSRGYFSEPAVLIDPVTWWCCWLLRMVSYN